MAGLSDASFMRTLAVPIVCLLIAYLGYFSQYLLRLPSLEPGPPSQSDTVLFNVILAILWYTYLKAVTEDPGRLGPVGWEITKERNWCRKCSAPKPVRAHHCRICGRCIPKMDHHCPWTANCVSMTTFPHFLRFLMFANISLWMLAYHLWQRCYTVWDTRHLPAYLGPTLPALAGLAFTSIVCFFLSFALGVMLWTTIRSWMFNCTMIESWEIERYERISDRGGQDWWETPRITGDDVFELVHFPYDLGIFINMSQAMGTANLLMWLWPFSAGPKVGKGGKGAGWEWEENGFNDAKGMWPPSNIKTLRRRDEKWPPSEQDTAMGLSDAFFTPEERKLAFQARKAQDIERRNKLSSTRKQVQGAGSDEDSDYASSGAGNTWTNSEGDTLEQYGVDRDADWCATLSTPEDNLPLIDVIRRRAFPSQDQT